MNYYFIVRLHVDVETYKTSSRLTTISSACAFVKSVRDSGFSLLGFEFKFVLNSGKVISFGSRSCKPCGMYGLYDILPDNSFTPYCRFRSILNFRKILSQYTKYCFLHYNS